VPWEALIKVLFVLILMVASFAPVVTWVERKQSAVMQDRIGANRADLFGIRILGLLHPAADVIKLIFKEDVVPEGANRVMHLVAPLIAAVGAIISFAVIPYGGRYTFGDTTFSLVAADIDWGLLYIFAVGSIAAYGTVIAGWASNNNWSLLGSLRASAQMISYEVTMGLSVVGIFMVFGTLKMSEMAFAQDATFRVLGFVEVFGLVEALPIWLDWIRLPLWGVFLQPLGFIMFLTAVMAENKRAPFDMPEGESEIVAGYHTEYSGMRFGLFFMAEFIEVIVIAALMTAIFLGGWSIPWLTTATLVGGLEPFLGNDFANLVAMVAHVLTFIIKVVVMIGLQMSLRWSLPRFRYDQTMDLCWKILLPLSIANVFVTGTIILLVKGLG